jgi:hypothetical protein
MPCGILMYGFIINFLNHKYFSHPMYFVFKVLVRNLLQSIHHEWDYKTNHWILSLHIQKYLAKLLTKIEHRMIRSLT